MAKFRLSLYLEPRLIYRLSDAIRECHGSRGGGRGGGGVSRGVKCPTQPPKIYLATVENSLHALLAYLSIDDQGAINTNSSNIRPGQMSQVALGHLKIFMLTVTTFSDF